MKTHHGYAYPAKYLCCILLTFLLLLMTVSAQAGDSHTDGTRTEGSSVQDDVGNAADAVGNAAKGAGRALGDAVSDIGDAAGSVIDGARDAMDGSRDEAAGSSVIPRTDHAAVPDAQASDGSSTAVQDSSGSFSWVLVLILIAAAAAIFFLLLMPRRGRSM